MPKVSVILLSFNNSQYIRESIQSILSQTYRDFELIIGDDASTDNSLEICRSFSDLRIKLLTSDKNLGIVDNIDRCLNATSGEFVGIMGSDDMMLPANIERKVRFLEENPYLGFVHSNHYLMDESGEMIGWHFSEYPPADTIFKGLDVFRRLIFEENVININTVMLPRNIFSKVGGYDRQFPTAHDYEFCARVALQLDIGYIAEPLFKYRYHPASVTQKTQDTPQKAVRKRVEVQQCKVAAFENYFKLPDKKIFTPDELRHLLGHIGWYYLHINELHFARRAFQMAVCHGTFSIKNILRYLATFLPLSTIKKIKSFKHELSRRKPWNTLPISSQSHS